MNLLEVSVNDLLLLLEGLKAAAPACLVTVESTQGSAPREAGAWMAVFADSLVGTIGYFIVHAARDDQGYMVPVETIERIEAEQHARLVAEKKIPANRVETSLEQA